MGWRQDLGLTEQTGNRQRFRRHEWIIVGSDLIGGHPHRPLSLIGTVIIDRIGVGIDQHQRPPTPQYQNMVAWYD